MRMLLTNDDGIDAPGLAALHAAIADLGEVFVVAPAKVQSATSHAVTFHRPMRVLRRGLGYAVEGRPADCVKLGLGGVLPGLPGGAGAGGAPFDVVISGMNAGANVGVNVLYSGTVGAAREATFEGVPAIAVSLHLDQWDHDHWGRAAGHAREAIRAVLAGPMRGDTLVNVNVPVLDGGREPVGIKAVPISTSQMVVAYEVREESEGSTYRVSNRMTFARHDAGTDVEALFAGYVTLSPLHFDLTCADSVVRWTRHLDAYLGPGPAHRHGPDAAGSSPGLPAPTPAHGRGSR